MVQTARTPSQIQRDVLYALLLREIGALFGRSRVGLLWVFVEPVAHLVVPITIFGYVLQRSLPDGGPGPVAQGRLLRRRRGRQTPGTRRRTGR